VLPSLLYALLLLVRLIIHLTGGHEGCDESAVTASMGCSLHTWWVSSALRTGYQQ
jgi:hypothetical protein